MSREDEYGPREGIVGDEEIGVDRAMRVHGEHRSRGSVRRAGLDMLPGELHADGVVGGKYHVNMDKKMALHSKQVNL